MRSVELSDASSPARNQAHPWGMILFLFAIVAVAEADALIRTIQSGGETEILNVAEESNPITLIGKLCFGICGMAWLLMPHKHRWNINGVFGWVLLAFLTWLFASVLWADDRLFVLKRVTIFAMMLAAAFAVADRFSYRDIMLLGLLCGFACLVSGLAADVILHKFTPFTSGYRFGGTTHANNQGWNCGALCLCATCLAVNARRGRLLFYGIAAAVLVFLVLTGSRTALGSTCAALAVIVAFRIPLLRLITLGLIAAMGLSFVLMFADESKVSQTILLNRKDHVEDEDASVTSLTGRTVLWKDFGGQVVDRPLLGRGFGGFWTPEQKQKASDIEDWHITDAHSAYIDMALDLGLPGVLLFISVILFGIHAYFRRCKEDRNIDNAFAMALLIFLATNMLLESRFAGPPPADAAIFVFLCIVLWVRIGLLSESPFSTASEDFATAESDASELPA